MTRNPHTSLTFLVVGMIILNLVGFGFYGSFYWSLRKVLHELDVVRQETREEVYRHKKLEAMNQFMNANRENIERINGQFVTKKTLVQFIDMLESLGRDVGVTPRITNLASGPSADGTKKALSLDIEMRGEFSRLFRYIELLEHLSYRLSVSDFQLGYGTFEGGKGEWLGTIPVKLLSYEE